MVGRHFVKVIPFGIFFLENKTFNFFKNRDTLLQKLRDKYMKQVCFLYVCQWGVGGY